MSKKRRKPGEEIRQDEEAVPVDVPVADDAMDAELEAVDAAQADTAAQPEAPEDGKLAQLKQDLETAKQKQDEYLLMAQRVQADFENFRRRNQNVRKEAFDDGARAFATTLLPVIDNLERAIAAAENSADLSLKEGVSMVCRQLTDAFDKRGITPIDRLNQPFDPNLENAVMQGAPEDGEPGTVCQVLQKGYQMDGVVLRHAMVKVVPE